MSVNELLFAPYALLLGINYTVAVFVLVSLLLSPSLLYSPPLPNHVSSSTLSAQSNFTEEEKEQIITRLAAHGITLSDPLNNYEVTGTQDEMG